MWEFADDAGPDLMDMEEKIRSQHDHRTDIVIVTDSVTNDMIAETTIMTEEIQDIISVWREKLNMVRGQ